MTPPVTPTYFMPHLSILMEQKMENVRVSCDADNTLQLLLHPRNPPIEDQVNSFDFGGQGERSPRRLNSLQSHRLGFSSPVSPLTPPIPKALSHPKDKRFFTFIFPLLNTKSPRPRPAVDGIPVANEDGTTLDKAVTSAHFRVFYFTSRPHLASSSLLLVLCWWL